MSVREYVGARYVPKFSDKNGGDWDNTYTYEALEIVKYGQDYYTAKIPVPTGIAITDTDYWVLTGNYNGAIASLTNRVNVIEGEIADINMLPVYNVADYGILPDTGLSVYDALFDFFHDVVAPNGGGTVFFPKGQYIVDYTILIPSNTKLVGEGDATEILFDLTDTYIGCAIANGGSNIIIEDMDINTTYNDPYPTRGSIPNSIGIGDFDFAANTRRSHTLVRKSGNTNIILNNVNSTKCHYGIQIEPGDYYVSNIFINNHQCRSGMFSVWPTKNTTIIENVYVNNLGCDTFRIGAGNFGGLKGLFVDGLFCSQMLIYTSDVTVNNFRLYSRKGNRATDSFLNDTAIGIAGKNIKLCNGYILRSSSSPQTRLLYADDSDTSFVNDLSLCNIQVERTAVFSVPNTADTTNPRVINCDFEVWPASYHVLTSPAASITSAIPVDIHYNVNPGCSYVKGLFVYDGTDDYAIGSLPSYVKNSNIRKNATGLAVAFNRTNSAVVPFPVGVVMLNGDIKIKTLGLPSATYDSVYVDLVW